MNDKVFFGVIGIIIVGIIGAVIAFGGGSTGQAFMGDPLEVQTGQTEQRADHVLGEGNKGVTIIEYSDFECPACLQFYPELSQIKSEYGDDIEVVYRHNPLSQLHPNAFAAHRAAIAASNQDRFWEMHSQIFEGWQSWSRQASGLSLEEAATVFEQYAEQLGLNMDQYREDVKSEETFNFIDSHLDSGSQLGVTGTPTVFLNGEEITARSAEELRVLIDEIIAENESSSSNEEQSTEPEEATPEEAPASEE